MVDLLFVVDDHRVDGVTDDGRPRDDERDEDEEERNGDVALLGVQQRRVERRIRLQSASVRVYLPPHAEVADDDDDHRQRVADGDAHAEVNVRRGVVGVLRVALRRVLRVRRPRQPRHAQRGGDGRPRPGGADHDEDAVLVERPAERVADADVLLYGDVHQRVDGGDEKKRRRESVERAHDAVAEDPNAADGGRQRDGQVEDGAEEVGESEAAQKHVRARAHAAVS